MTASLLLIHAGSKGECYLISAYYNSGVSPDDAIGQFDGQGIKRLGLADNAEIRVEDSRVSALFKGKHPVNWSPLRREVGNRLYADKVHKPVSGLDITLSVPIEVSALFGAGSDQTRKIILTCLNKAAAATREHVERKLAYTRTGAGGCNREKVGLVWAAFPHIEDRAGMPQLHVHNVLFNLGVRENGKAGALDLRPVLKANTVYELGQVFRDSLRGHLSFALEDAHLQFPVVPIKNGRSFTVKGHKGEEIPAELLKAYSPRSEAIKNALKETKEPTAKQIQAAVLKTRPAKPHPKDRNKRAEEWRLLARDKYAFSSEAFFSRSRERYIKTATDLAMLQLLEERANKRNKDQCQRRTQIAHNHAEEIATNLFRQAEGRTSRKQLTKITPQKAKERKKLSEILSPRSLTKSIVTRLESRFIPSTYSYEGAFAEARAKSEKRAKRLRRLMHFRYVTYQIDYATYKKFTEPPKPMTRIGIEARYWSGSITLGERLALRKISGHEPPKYGMPKTRIAINLAYATRQITRTQQLILLRRNGLITPTSPEIRIRQSHT